MEIAREGMYYREFCPSFDWEHIGEGMAGWYWYGMARPRDTRSSTGFPRSVAVNSLLHLMLGANYPGGSGNALHAQLRYFDPDRRRAGLAPDVGALVERISAAGVTLILVNTSPVHGRDVVVQTGGYGEHRCTSVDDSHFRVRLEPGSGGRLVLSLKRYANVPTLAFPWDR